MKRYKPGQKVRIIGADNSGPVDEMYNMIGLVATIEYVSDDGVFYRLKNNGYSWCSLDLQLIKPVNVKGGLFDTNNLILEGQNANSSCK